MLLALPTHPLRQTIRRRRHHIPHLLRLTLLRLQIILQHLRTIRQLHLHIPQRLPRILLRVPATLPPVQTIRQLLLRTLRPVRVILQPHLRILRRVRVILQRLQAILQHHHHILRLLQIIRLRLRRIRHLLRAIRRALRTQHLPAIRRRPHLMGPHLLRTRQLRLPILRRLLNILPEQVRIHHRLPRTNRALVSTTMPCHPNIRRPRPHTVRLLRKRTPQEPVTRPPRRLIDLEAMAHPRVDTRPHRPPIPAIPLLVRATIHLRHQPIPQAVPENRRTLPLLRRIPLRRQPITLLRRQLMKNSCYGPCL